MTSLPYVAPMALFLLLTTLESIVPRSFYPWAYAVKILLVLATLLYFSRVWREEIHLDPRFLLPAVAVGLLVFGEWVWLEKVVPYPLLGTRTAYNPLVEIENPILRNVFIGLRFAGLALLVPVMEEVFWRSFLLRYLTDRDRWQGIAVGDFSLTALGIATMLFALAHPEWLVAALCALLYTGLLRVTRSLFACIVAHGVTNLALGIYVLMTCDWKFW